jgi:long-chain acyl-CoA synthetase
MLDTHTDASRLPLALRLSDILSWRATRAGNEPAVIYERQPFIGTVLTWRELDDNARRFAQGLAAHNVKRGSRVALVLQDSPECLATLFAIWRLGAVVIPIDERWTVGTAKAVLSHAAPVCIAGDHAPAFEFGTSLTFVSFDELQHHHSGAAHDTVGHCDDLAMITYTSGTTSNPKGVILRHRHLRNAYRIARDSLFNSPPKRIGNVFRTAGLGALGINYLFGMECGIPVVVLTALGVETVRGFWNEVKRNSVDFIYLVPTLVQLLTRLSEPVEDSRTILCITGGAPISERTHSVFQDRFGHPLRNVYGLTEATCGIFWGAYEPDGRGAWHLGRPPRGIQVRLRDPEGRSGDSVTEGEIEVSGPLLSDGYWMNPEATREVFVDGWLRTGDIAQRDKYGNYTITGRMKDVVIRGGFNIHLEEVDQTLLAHPYVLSACAVGITDASGEEKLAAMVQLRAGAQTTAEDLANWCRARIGSSKTPAPIVLADDDLPRNSSGKVIRTGVVQAITELSKHRHA